MELPLCCVCVWSSATKSRRLDYSFGNKTQITKAANEFAFSCIQLCAQEGSPLNHSSLLRWQNNRISGGWMGRDVDHRLFSQHCLRAAWFWVEKTAKALSPFVFVFIRPIHLSDAQQTHTHAHERSTLFGWVSVAEGILIWFGLVGDDELGSSIDYKQPLLWTTQSDFNILDIRCDFGEICNQL